MYIHKQLFDDQNYKTNNHFYKVLYVITLDWLFLSR